MPAEPGMSLLKYSFFDVLKSSLRPETWAIILPDCKDTLYMVSVSSLCVLLFGTVFGILLAVTSDDGLCRARWFNRTFGAVTNCLRSLPQTIMMILVQAAVRIAAGNAYGMNTFIIALAVSIIPMYSRIVESSMLEIHKGKIEAAKAMGSSNFQIIRHVLLPETLPSIIRGFTVTVITVVSMSALAGMFGAGGLGYAANKFGLIRFQHDVLFAIITAMIILVQAVQLAGDFISKSILRKRHLV